MSLQKNLAELAASRNSRKKANKSSILQTIMEISESRANQPVADSSSLQNAAGRKLEAGHFPGDGHNHGPSGPVSPGMDAKFNSALQRLVQDSGGKISVGSGYRSLAEQQVLYDRWIRRVPGQAPAAKPGSSNHNYGLAADLKYKPGGREFAHANAGKYGLRFPMSYEPWHIEPIDAKARRGKK